MCVYYDLNSLKIHAHNEILPMRRARITEKKKKKTETNVGVHVENGITIPQKIKR